MNYSSRDLVLIQHGSNYNYLEVSSGREHIMFDTDSLYGQNVLNT